MAGSRTGRWLFYGRYASTSIDANLPEAPGPILWSWPYIRLLLSQPRRGLGPIQILWDGRDDLGEAIATGAYFYRLVAGTVSKNRRLLLK